MSPKETDLIKRIVAGAKRLAEGAAEKGKMHPKRKDPDKKLHGEESGNLFKIIQKLLSKEREVDKKSAVKFTADATSADTEMRKQALQSLKENKLAVLQSGDGQERDAVLAQARDVLEKSTSKPDWLPQNIENPAALEYALRLSAISKEQQEDPYVLYHLTAQLYAQAPWGKMTDEEVRNTRALLDQAFAQVKRLAQKSGSDFVYKDGDDIEGVLTGRLDLYKSRRLDIQEDSGKTAEFLTRREELEKFLEEQQRVLDRDMDSRTERVELNKVIGDMRKRMEPDDSDVVAHETRSRGKAGDVITKYKFNASDVLEYQKIIEDRLKLLEGRERGRVPWSPVVGQREAAPTLSPDDRPLPFAGFMDDLLVEDLPPELQLTIHNLDKATKDKKLGTAFDANTMNNILGDIEAKARSSRLSSEQEIKLKIFLTRARSKLQEQRYERAYSSIYLDPDEIKQILKNPLYFLDQYALRIEKAIWEDGMDSPAIEAMFNRYKLISEFFSSETYNTQILGPLPDGVTPSEIILLKQRRRQAYELFQTKTEVLDEYANRLQHMRTIYDLNFVRDFEKEGGRFFSEMDQLSDKRAYAMRGLYNGLVDVFSRNFLWPVAREKLLGDEFLSVEKLRDILTTAKALFAANIHLYEPGYRQYIADKFGPLNQMLGLSESTDIWELSPERIDSIARLAFASDRVFQKAVGMQHLGLSDWEGELYGLQNNFIFTLAERRLVKDRWIWYKRCWGASPQERESIKQGSLTILAMDDEVRSFAHQRGKELWGRLRSWSGKNETPTDTKLLRELYIAFAEYPEKTELGDTPTDPKTLEFFKRLRGDGLGVVGGRRVFMQQVAIDVANVWQEECGGPGAYDVFKSGVRRGAILKEIKDSLTAKYGGEVEPKLEQLGQGLKLYAKGMDWFFPLKEARSKHEKDAYIATLKEVARLHPHELLLLEAEHEVGVDIYNPDNFNQDHQDFNLVQSLVLTEKKMKLIDYFKGPDAGQMALVRKAFTSDSGVCDEIRMNAYLARQKQRAERYLTNGGVERFTHMKYANRMREILFYDDLPMDDIDTKVLKTANDPGAHNLIPRAWKDNAQHAAAAGDMILAALAMNDEKEILKLAQGTWGKIQSYQTEARAQVARALVGARYVGMVRQELAFGKNLKEGSLYISPAQRRGSMTDPGYNIEEVSEFIEKLNMGVNINSISPYFGEAVEVRGGITAWRAILLGNKGPLARTLGHEKFNKVVEILNAGLPFQETALKVVRVAGFAGLLALLYLGKEATSKVQKAGDHG